MRDDLLRNYDAALSDAAGRGVTPRVQQLETLLQATVATINVDPMLLRNMAYSQNYMSYYRSLDQGLRKIAEQEYHAHREAVDAKVHTGYGAEIVNAALSSNGRGLTNYGPITLELKGVTIEDRASVLRENAFDFYERYDLGRRDAVEEPGWRSTWTDRSLLGDAHLEHAVTPVTGGNSLARLIQFTGAARPDDRYIEVNVFGEISWQSLAKVTLERPLTEPEHRLDWDFGRRKLSRRNVIVVDRSGP